MSGRLLGETFDIHGGGLDLVFPHHENEIAQSESRHGKPMARYWMHNGLMQASSEVGKVGGRNTRAVEGDIQSQDAGKISKSRGSRPFRELLAEFEPETIRFFLLSTHYRRPIDFGEERIREVQTGLATFYRFFKRFERIAGKDFYAIEAAKRRGGGDFQPGGDAVLAAVAEFRQRFLEAMDDDFNTGGAIGILFDLLRRLNKFADDEKLEDGQPPQARLAVLEQGVRTLRELGGTLGLFRPPQQTSAAAKMPRRPVELLIEARRRGSRRTSPRQSPRLADGPVDRRSRARRAGDGRSERTSPRPTRLRHATGGDGRACSKSGRAVRIVLTNEMTPSRPSPRQPVTPSPREHNAGQARPLRGICRSVTPSPRHPLTPASSHPRHRSGAAERPATESWSRSRGELRLCEAGVVRAPASGPISQRLAAIYDGVCEVIAALKPTVMALEELYSHYQRPRTAILMGHARGVICLAGEKAGIPVIHYSATQVKRILTGSGHAPKSQVQRAIQQELGLASLPEPADVADALAIALCHYYLKNKPRAGKATR